MASTPKGMQKSSISFIDWEGLSSDDYRQLDKIINQSTACSAVKLPFSPYKKKHGNRPGKSPVVQKNQEQQPTPVETTLTNSGGAPVFQANVPPPTHQAPAVAPVMAYPIPVHHWPQGAHPPHGPPPHFPMAVQGSYVFPNQPPPPLVTTGDAATIAFVAAMSSGQPLYAIPGVHLQSIHTHYPGGYPQAEPMDLSVVPQQPVTVHHFVQPDGMVFTPSPHPMVPPPVIPVSLPPTPAHMSNGSQGAGPPFTDHHHYRGDHSDTHIVYMPPEVDSSSQQPNTHPTTEADKPPPSVTSKKPSPSQSQTNSKPTIVSSPVSGVEFGGPIVFGSDDSIAQPKPVSNGSVPNQSQISPTPPAVVNDIAKLKISDNASSDTPALPGSCKVVESTQTVVPGSSEPQEVHAPPVSSSEPSVPPCRKVADSHHGEKTAAQLSKDSDKNQSEKTCPIEIKVSVNQPAPSTPAQPTSPTLAQPTSPTSAQPTSPTSVQPQASPQAPKMWSSLFGKPKTLSVTVSPVSPMPDRQPAAASVAITPAAEVKSVHFWQEKEQADAAKLSFVPTQKVTAVGTQNDPLAPRILNMLSNMPVIHTPIVIQPRGLVNGSNVCFMNATLQVLMGCPPFIHLFRAFKNLPARPGKASCTPIFDSLIEFVNSFQNGQRVKTQGSRNKKGAYPDINVGHPFSPTSLLNVAQDILGLRIGIQHDAEEFLSKILMLCHEELENVMKLNPSNVLNNNNGEAAVSNGYAGEAEEDDDESWQKVGPKNHHVETNVNDCGQTPLSSIFSGLSRSCLTRETGKNSDTVDSFFTLKLDIQGDNVYSVTDALQRLNLLETLHDMDGGKIQGQRRMFFDVLPPVLIMHLKLFQYSSDGGGKKIQKKIDFDVDLTIPKETLSRVGKSKYTSPKSRSYKLFGVVNHHGLKMTDGHYTSDVYLPVASGWLRFDDNNVYAIHEKQVLQHSDRHMPYLLFYRRMDIA